MVDLRASLPGATLIDAQLPQAADHGKIVGQTQDVIVLYRDQHGRAMRARLHYDTYAAQAYGVLECWDGKRWNEVYAMLGKELECSPHLKRPDEVDYGADLSRLQRAADAVFAARV